MKEKVYFFLLFISLYSCFKTEKKPKDLLSKEQMRDVLIETNLSINMAYNTGADTKLRNIKDKPDKQFLKIITSRGISLNQYKKSHQYYTKHPKTYQSIFKMIQDSLSVKLKQLKIEDSIEKIKKKKIKANAKKVLTDRQKKEIYLNPLYKKLDSIKNNRKK